MAQAEASARPWAVTSLSLWSEAAAWRSAPRRRPRAWQEGKSGAHALPHARLSRTGLLSPPSPAPALEAQREPGCLQAKSPAEVLLSCSFFELLLSFRPQQLHVPARPFEGPSPLLRVRPTGAWDSTRSGSVGPCGRERGAPHPRCVRGGRQEGGGDLRPGSPPGKPAACSGLGLASEVALLLPFAIPPRARLL